MSLENNEKKLYVLDTNVLIAAPHSIFAFDENDVAITEITLEELDKFKTAPGEKGVNSREVLRIIAKLNEKGNCFSSSIQTGSQHFVPLNEKGGCFTIFAYDSGLNFLQKNDDKIIQICGRLTSIEPFMIYSKIVLVTNDLCMQIKCGRHNVKSQPYLSEDTSHEKKEQFCGRINVFADGEIVDKLYDKENAEIACEQVYVLNENNEPQQPTLYQNEFVVIKDDKNSSHSSLGIVKGNVIKPLSSSDLYPQLYGIEPKNVGQKFALDALLAPADEIPLVLLIGAAGTAKTFLSLLAGLYRQQKGMYNRVLIARPNIKFDEDIGYLKGSEEDKIAPLMRPIMDNLDVISMYSRLKTEKLIEEDIVRAEALAYMRGRSITNTFIIIDEAQNLTPTQAFGIVSRAGFGSKVVLTGDPQQIDTPRLTSTRNGLSYTAEKMKDSNLCAQLSFTEKECVRSDLAKEAIKKLTPKGSDVLI